MTDDVDENASRARALALIADGDALLIKQKDLDGAERVYRSALDADPSCADAAFSIACVYSHRRAFADAISWSKRALTLDPAHEGAHYQVGNALLGLGRHAEDKLALEDSYRRTKSDMTLGQIGLCCEKLGLFAQAERHIRTVLEKDPTYLTRHLATAFCPNMDRGSGLRG